MTSLSEVYQSDRGPGLRRLYAGVGLFVVGALLVVAGIVVAATDVLLGSMTLGGVRELGGVLGGVGVPAVFLGVLTVLPANRRTRLAALAGAAVSLVGVWMFTLAYPCQWSGSTCGTDLANLTLPTVGVYFAGAITTFWCLFVGVANFKTRNDPGGTAKVDVVKQGRTRIVEVDRSRGLGGIGFFGGTPDGNVETQTNVSETNASRANVAQSDGGAATENLSPPLDDAEVVPSERGGPVGDAYCGTCRHFEYVRTGDGIEPYCTYHDGLLDDMDACDQWTARR